jgi:hypothetical protein
MDREQKRTGQETGTEAGRGQEQNNKETGQNRNKDWRQDRNKNKDKDRTGTRSKGQLGWNRARTRTRDKNKNKNKNRTRTRTRTRTEQGTEQEQRTEQEQGTRGQRQQRQEQEQNKNTDRTEQNKNKRTEPWHLQKQALSNKLFGNGGSITHNNKQQWVQVNGNEINSNIYNVRKYANIALLHLTSCCSYSSKLRLLCDRLYECRKGPGAAERSFLLWRSRGHRWGNLKPSMPQIFRAAISIFFPHHPALM